MSFKEIIGQDKPISILKSALAKNRLAHAYLFEGPPGCGKVFTALNFAKALNCLQPSEGGTDCCDQCNSCKKIDAGNLIDVSFLGLLKGKHEILIEQIRQMQLQINMKPYEAEHKVFCIPDAELMNEEAQSALLKTLEEPPVKSIIILTTSKPNELFTTIISRCQSIKFSALSIDCIKDILIKRYNIKIDEAYFLAHITQSGLIDISGQVAGDVLANKNKIIDEFNDFLNSPGMEPPFLKESDEYILWSLSVLLWWYRDMLVFKETAPLAGAGKTDMLANRDRIRQLGSYAEKYSSLGLADIIKSILRTAQALTETNVNAKLALTVMAMDLLHEV